MPINTHFTHIINLQLHFEMKKYVIFLPKARDGPAGKC